jgi:hypothetical protein
VVYYSVSIPLTTACRPCLRPLETATMTLVQISAEELAALRAAAAGPRKGLSLKVSDKGAISIYGMGRFPVTLYREQWERLITPEFAQEMQAFITANASRLKVKGA